MQSPRTCMGPLLLCITDRPNNPTPKTYTHRTHTEENLHPSVRRVQAALCLTPLACNGVPSGAKSGFGNVLSQQHTSDTSNHATGAATSTCRTHQAQYGMVSVLLLQPAVIFTATVNQHTGTCANKVCFCTTTAARLCPTYQVHVIAQILPGSLLSPHSPHITRAKFPLAGP